MEAALIKVGKMPGRPADLRFELLNEGKHSIVLYDWQQYVVFADRFLK